MPGAFGWTSGLLQASRPQPEYLCEPILFWLYGACHGIGSFSPWPAYMLCEGAFVIALPLGPSHVCRKLLIVAVISDKNQSGARDVFDLRALTVLFYLLKDRSHGFRKRSYLPHLGLLPSTAWNDHAIVRIDIVPG